MRILTKAEEEVYLMFFKEITTRGIVSKQYSLKHSKKIKPQKEINYEKELKKKSSKYKELVESKERGFTVPFVLECIKDWKKKGYFDVCGTKIPVPSGWKNVERHNRAEGLMTSFKPFFEEIRLDRIVFNSLEKDYITKMLDAGYFRNAIFKRQNFVEGIKNFLFGALAIQLHFQRSNQTKIKVPFWIISNYLSAEKTPKVFEKIRRSKKIEDITKIVGKVTNGIIKQNKLSKRERKKYADYINFVSYSIYLPFKIPDKILMLLGKDSFHLSEVIQQNLRFKDYERELESRTK